jgi:antagonist of KipI
MSLVVLEPGIEARIVDLGRPRSRSLGVPVGGAADRRSLILGNSLIGNPPDAPALEFALKGPHLRALTDTGGVLFGAPFETHCDGYPVEIGRSFTLTAGQELRIGGARRGARAYLCVCGGFDVPAILASRSALEPIQKADALPCAASRLSPRFCPELSLTEAEVPIIGVMPGLQATWFDDAEFHGQEFRVTPASNRMGIRLSGRPLTMPGREMLSEPVCPGSVQVTRDGQCIVLGVDGQTIGGYPKIAQVIQADLDALGQLRPGQGVRFVKVPMEEAIRRDRAARSELHEWSVRLIASFEPVA